MKALVIYESVYGTTKAYADYIASALKATQVPYNKGSQEYIDQADCVVLGGAIYVDQIKAMKILNKFNLKDKPLYCFGVGLTKPTKAYTESMKNKYFASSPLQCEAFLMLSGKLEIDTLKLKHRALLKVVGAMLKKKKEPLTDKEQGIIKALEETVDHVNLNNVDGLIKRIKENH